MKPSVFLHDLAVFARLSWRHNRHLIAVVPLMVTLMCGCAGTTKWARENVEAVEFKGGYGEAYARSRVILRPLPTDGFAK